MKVMPAPGKVQSAMTLKQPIKVTKKELAASNLSKVYKRDLIFSGSQQGSLMFTERIYEDSSNTPTQAFPIIVKVDTLPASVDVRNAYLMS